MLIFIRVDYFSLDQMEERRGLNVCPVYLFG